jgi:hypothetical protein
VKIEAWMDRTVVSAEPVDVSSTGARSKWSLAGKHYALDSRLIFSMERPVGEFEKLQSDWRRRKQRELIDALPTLPESAVDETVEIRVEIKCTSGEDFSFAAGHGALEALMRHMIGGTK